MAAPTVAIRGASNPLLFISSYSSLLAAGTPTPAEAPLEAAEHGYTLGCRKGCIKIRKHQLDRKAEYFPLSPSWPSARVE